jgi:rhodanese-related sulfurtransferase
MTKEKNHMSRKHQKHIQKRRSIAWLWVSLGAVLVAIAGILALAEQGRSSAAPSTTQTLAAVEISPADAYAKYLQGAFFLDVRTQEEWNQFHIKGSTLIPLDQLPDRLVELPKDRNIIVVCLSGHRSQSGVAMLLQAGFTHVSCMNGGLQAWMDANYPVEKGAP